MARPAGYAKAIGSMTSAPRTSEARNTNCAVGNAARVGETSPGPSATTVSPPWKFSTTTMPCAPHLPANGSPRVRPACGATPALLPLPQDYRPTVPAGFTPLLEAPRLAQTLGAKHLFLKNDAVCLPSLSFKDRVVAVALSQARSFGFDTVSCSSTGNLANAVAAQAARMDSKPGSSFRPILSRRRFWVRKSLALSWCASRAATTRSTACARRSPMSGTGDS